MPGKTLPEPDNGFGVISGIHPSHLPFVEIRKRQKFTINQKDESGVSRNANSSAVLFRPREALRCGKRPKRAMISR